MSLKSIKTYKRLAQRSRHLPGGIDLSPPSSRCFFAPANKLPGLFFFQKTHLKLFEVPLVRESKRLAQRLPLQGGSTCLPLQVDISGPGMMPGLFLFPHFQPIFHGL